MSNVFIDGKKFLIQLWSRDLGLKRKIKLSSIWYIRMEPRIGVKLQLLFQEE
jgi:hypothetical protein